MSAPTPTPQWRDIMASYDPRSEAQLSEWIAHLGTPGGDGLDARTRQLIWVASSTAVRAEPSLRTHMRKAVDEGATELEIYQSMVLGASSGGVPALISGLSILHELFQKGEQ